MFRDPAREGCLEDIGLRLPARRIPADAAQTSTIVGNDKKARRRRSHRQRTCGTNSDRSAVTPFCSKEPGRLAPRFSAVHHVVPPPLSSTAPPVARNAPFRNPEQNTRQGIAVLRAT